MWPVRFLEFALRVRFSPPPSVDKERGQDSGPKLWFPTSQTGWLSLRRRLSTFPGLGVATRGTRVGPGRALRGPRRCSDPNQARGRPGRRGQATARGGLRQRPARPAVPKRAAAGCGGRSASRPCPRAPARRVGRRVRPGTPGLQIRFRSAGGGRLGAGGRLVFLSPL